MSNLDELHKELEKQTAEHEEVAAGADAVAERIEAGFQELADKLEEVKKKIEGEQGVQDDRLTELEP